MTSKLQKWGNSLGVRIPKSIIEKVNIEENDELIIEHQDGKIVIFPAKKKISLSELMDQVNPENLHSEDDFKPEGNEVW
ncbi:MAG TPA: AbrB/MazE/SpoVT family DNA-binding domain-containing protein [Bacteriovoracaceae bacterium]|nr:AbrB/MazE/SpoVT family DNA-binding domain-containing protein [Bacteriovoracaceae bacterium]